MTATRAEAAGLFATEPDRAPANANLLELVYPGHPASVFDGATLRTMHWGFPLSLRGTRGQVLKPRPVNNTRSDHLSSPFWRDSFRHRRCLIPLDAYAEAEGAKGHKTRTWISLPDRRVFACAGLWRESQEWGACFSMVITDACVAVADVHHRMPVMLAPEDYAVWLSGDADQARALCRPWEGLLAIDRSTQAWSDRAASAWSAGA